MSGRSLDVALHDLVDLQQVDLPPSWWELPFSNDGLL